MKKERKRSMMYQLDLDKILANNLVVVIMLMRIVMLMKVIMLMRVVMVLMELL
jgi:hypothetical protein